MAKGGQPSATSVAKDDIGADRLALVWASALSSIWRFTCHPSGRVLSA
jgi:hypothetical protein